MKGFKAICGIAAFVLSSSVAVAGDISFRTIEEKVLAADRRCTACHGTEGPEVELTYEAMKGYLEDATEEEILNDEWFPMTYCNGPLDEAGKDLIIQWHRAGLPQ